MPTSSLPKASRLAPEPISTALLSAASSSELAPEPSIAPPVCKVTRSATLTVVSATMFIAPAVAPVPASSPAPVPMTTELVPLSVITLDAPVPLMPPPAAALALAIPDCSMKVLAASMLTAAELVDSTASPTSSASIPILTIGDTLASLVATAALAPRADASVVSAPAKKVSVWAAPIVTVCAVMEA